jgi:hypothetical protein
MYRSEVWQILTKDMNSLLLTEVGFLERLVGISTMDKVRNIKIREIMRLAGKPDIIDNSMEPSHS